MKSTTVGDIETFARVQESAKIHPLDRPDHEDSELVSSCLRITVAVEKPIKRIYVPIHPPVDDPSKIKYVKSANLYCFRL